MYHFKASPECRLTVSLPLIKLFLDPLVVAINRGDTIVLGYVLAEKGGPNPCFGIAQSIA